MQLNLTPVMDKTRNLFLSIAMDDKVLPIAFITLGVVLLIHSMTPDRKPAHVDPVGTTFLKESGF